MRIQYLSDLHLEFSENHGFCTRAPLPVKGDVLVLAGDTMPLSNRQLMDAPFWRLASVHYRQVLLIPGNHEYYGSDMLRYGDSWHLMLAENVGYYQNEVVRVGDTDFILSTMWSHIEERYKLDIWMGLNDFRKIRYGGRRLTPEDFNREHVKCLRFIMDAVRASMARHIVVVTHHVPTKECVDPEYLGSPINSAFTADLTDFIASSRIDCWIYGHSHVNIDRRIGGTRVVSNQLGYVSLGEDKDNGFDFKKNIPL